MGKNKTTKKPRRKNLKKGGDGYIRTDSLVYYTFMIKLKQQNETKSVYITIDNSWLYVIVELNGVIYCITEGWNWNYFQIKNFILDNGQLTYTGTKYDKVQNTIVLTGENNIDASIVSDPTIKEKLRGWHGLKDMKDIGAFTAVDISVDTAINTGCVIC